MHPESALQPAQSDAPSRSPNTPPASPPPTPTLPVDLSAAIRADAQRTPDAYLKASEVPYGGE